MMFGNVSQNPHSELYHDLDAFMAFKGSNQQPYIRNHFRNAGHYMWKLNTKALP